MRRRQPLGWSLGVVGLVMLSGCSATRAASVPPGFSSSRAAQAVVAPSPAVPTQPGAPGAQPGPAGTLDSSVPAAGTVVLGPGPFVDRLTVSGLTLSATAPAGVTGTVAVTSDVSDVIVLELRAAFYGAAGQLLGIGTTSYREGDGAGGGPGTQAEQLGVPFTVPAPADATGITSAVLTVPVLVNE